MIRGKIGVMQRSQNHQTESEDQDLCGNLSECTPDPDLDSIDRSLDPEVSQVPLPVPVVAVEPGGNAAI